MLYGIIDNLIPIFVILGQAAQFRHPIFGQAGALFVQIRPFVICLAQRRLRVSVFIVPHLINVQIDVWPLARLIYGVIFPNFVPDGRFCAAEAVCHLLELFVCLAVPACLILRLSISGAVIGQKVLQAFGKLRHLHFFAVCIQPHLAHGVLHRGAGAVVFGQCEKFIGAFFLGKVQLLAGCHRGPRAVCNGHLVCRAANCHGVAARPAAADGIIRRHVLPGKFQLHYKGISAFFGLLCNLCTQLARSVLPCLGGCEIDIAKAAVGRRIKGDALQHFMAVGNLVTVIIGFIGDGRISIVFRAVIFLWRLRLCEICRVFRKRHRCAAHLSFQNIDVLRCALANAHPGIPHTAAQGNLVHLFVGGAVVHGHGNGLAVRDIAVVHPAFPHHNAVALARAVVHCGVVALFVALCLVSRNEIGRAALFQQQILILAAVLVKLVQRRHRCLPGRCLLCQDAQRLVHHRGLCVRRAVYGKNRHRLAQCFAVSHAVNGKCGRGPLRGLCFPVFIQPHLCHFVLNGVGNGVCHRGGIPLARAARLPDGRAVLHGAAALCKGKCAPAGSVRGKQVFFRARALVYGAFHPAVFQLLPAGVIPGHGATHRGGKVLCKKLLHALCHAGGLPLGPGLAFYAALQRQLYHHVLKFRLESAGLPHLGGCGFYRVCDAVGQSAPIVQKRVAGRAHVRGGDVHQLAVLFNSVGDAAGCGIHLAKHLFITAGRRPVQRGAVQIFAHHIQVFITLCVIFFQCVEQKFLFVNPGIQRQGDNSAVRPAHRRSGGAGLALAVTPQLKLARGALALRTGSHAFVQPHLVCVIRFAACQRQIQGAAAVQPVGYRAEVWRRSVIVRNGKVIPILQRGNCHLPRLLALGLADAIGNLCAVQVIFPGVANFHGARSGVVWV